MGYDVTSVDRTALPAAMLDIAKQHIRVTWTTEDDYIKLCLVRAIDLVERHSGASIFPRAVSWTPDLVPLAWVYRFPLQPVATWKAFNDLTEVTTEYEISVGSSVRPVYLVHSDQSVPADGVRIDFTTGFAYADMPPQYLDPILRIAAQLYAYRESIDVSGLSAIPGWANDLLVGNWIPRV
jgi:uncharacterized phiE125 gp8 family phage protein